MPLEGKHAIITWISAACSPAAVSRGGSQSLQLLICEGNCSRKSTAEPLCSCLHLHIMVQAPVRQSPRSQAGPGVPPAQQQQQLLMAHPVTFLKRSGMSWQNTRL